MQSVFKNVFNLEAEIKQDGSDFDHLFADGEVFNIGKIEAKVTSPQVTRCLLGVCDG